jgi:hypothetical protein
MAGMLADAQTTRCFLQGRKKAEGKPDGGNPRNGIWSVAGNR